MECFSSMARWIRRSIYCSSVLRQSPADGSGMVEGFLFADFFAAMTGATVALCGGVGNENLPAGERTESRTADRTAKLASGAGRVSPSALEHANLLQLHHLIHLEQPTGFSGSELVLDLADLAGGFGLRLVLRIDGKSAAEHTLQHGEFVAAAIALGVASEFRQENLGEGLFVVSAVGDQRLPGHDIDLG